jgi:hypothetical protein
MNRLNYVFGAVALVALALGITAIFMTSSNASSASRDTAAASAQQRTANVRQRTDTAQLRTQVRAITVVQAKNTKALSVDSAALGKNTSVTARLGVCWSVSYGTASGDYGSYAESVSIDAPIVTSGVTTCPSGDTFVPVG